MCTCKIPNIYQLWNTAQWTNFIPLFIHILTKKAVKLMNDCYSISAPLALGTLPYSFVHILINISIVCVPRNPCLSTFFAWHSHFITVFHFNIVKLQLDFWEESLLVDFLQAPILFQEVFGILNSFLALFLLLLQYFGSFILWPVSGVHSVS